jgi:hypothetical protein
MHFDLLKNCRIKPTVHWFQVELETFFYIRFKVCLVHETLNSGRTYNTKILVVQHKNFGRTTQKFGRTVQIWVV